MSKPLTNHWADINAAKILREKGEKEQYVCASGITPSGTVHIGNFREIISVDLIVRALRDLGKKVRFIYSWDDYDVFRKVPKNMPQPEILEKYLRQPITLVPDTRGVAENYAQANEQELEKLLPLVGIQPEYIYQAQMYRASKYAEGIKTSLEKEAVIREILNEHRSCDLAEDWWPISVFSNKDNKDTAVVTDWDGQYRITYKSEDGSVETVDLRATKAVKLPWRLDWPMRWVYEGVDFEPAGKDHHSEGGSFTTAKTLVEKVYGGEAPVTFQYDFISIKGRGGKISSSTGEVISLADVLEVYTPELTRYLFASTRPNAEFAISFDLDVLKIYEDYDKCERIYYKAQEAKEKEYLKQKRIYELSQVDKPLEEMPYQVSIRHLTNFLQVFDGDLDATIAALGDVADYQVERLRAKAACAWNWVRQFAPEDFRFQIQPPGSAPISLQETEKKLFAAFLAELEKNWDSYDEKSLNDYIYDVARAHEVEPKDFFPLLYQALIRKEKGPKVAGFLKTIGRDKLLSILSEYR
jgi:lysyl-tRNA synthetase class 1